MTSAIDPNIIVVGSPVSKSAMKTQLTTAASEITELQNRPGRRNRIINGDMRIDQRNAGASQSISTASAYTVDRWAVAPTGASVTGQRVAGSSGYQYAYRVTGAASVTGIVFQQRIESANTADLVNQNVTLSAVISNSLLTTVSWTAYSANTVDNFSAQTLIASGSFTVTSTATQYTATFNAGANAANGIAIAFSVGAQISGTWTTTGVQLEPGSVASVFERLSIGETLMLCQRYYETGQNVICIGGGTQGTLTDVKVFSGFRVTKRVAPTMTFGYSAPIVVSTGTSGVDGTTVYYTAGNSNNFNATFYATAEL